MMDTDNNRWETVRERIAEQGMILFGTGYVAGLWEKILRSCGLWDAVPYCVVSGRPAEPEFAGRKVYCLEEAPFRDGEKEALPILGVAVHESLRDSLLPALEKRYPGECLFLYPWLFEAAFGKPVEEKPIRVAELLAAQPADNYWITLRYAVLCGQGPGREENAHTRFYTAVRDRLQPARTAGGIYLAVQSLFSGRNTAAGRLARFLDLAERTDREEILRTRPILLDTQNRVIDGLHRIALARFEGIGSLPCLVTAAAERYEEFFSEKNRATAAAQCAAGLSPAERELLSCMREEMLRGNKNP